MNKKLSIQKMRSIKWVPGNKIFSYFLVFFSGAKKTETETGPQRLNYLQPDTKVQLYCQQTLQQLYVGNSTTKNFLLFTFYFYSRVK